LKDETYPLKGSKKPRGQNMILKGPYFPKGNQTPVLKAGDVVTARDNYFKTKPRNLINLLNIRYQWMNNYLKPSDIVVEFGAGAGLVKEFIDVSNYLVTDITPRPWVDKVVDALNPPFQDESLDAIICSHMIHHLAQPIKFLSIAERLLKPGGYLLISEVNCSLLMRILLKTLRHEGWSFEPNIFDVDVTANDPHDPWSGNNAIPNMVFSDTNRFHNYFPNFELIENTPTECIKVLVAGGVISKSKTIQLPEMILSIINGLDRILVAFSPPLFALGRQICIRKKINIDTRN